MGLDTALSNWWQVQRGKHLGSQLLDIDRSVYLSMFGPYGSLEGILGAQSAYRAWVEGFPRELRHHPAVGHLFYEGSIALARVCKDASEKVTDASQSEAHWQEATTRYISCYLYSPNAEHKAEACYELASYWLGRYQVVPAERWLNRLIATGVHFGSQTMTENLELLLEMQKDLDHKGQKLDDMGLGPT